jgi:hypothetical protein
MYVICLFRIPRSAPDREGKSGPDEGVPESTDGQGSRQRLSDDVHTQGDEEQDQDVFL